MNIKILFSSLILISLSLHGAAPKEAAEPQKATVNHVLNGINDELSELSPAELHYLQQNIAASEAKNQRLAQSRTRQPSAGYDPKIAVKCHQNLAQIVANFQSGKE